MNNAAIFVTTNNRRIVYITIGWSRRIAIPEGESLFSLWVKRERTSDREGYSTYKFRIGDVTLSPYDVFHITTIEIHPLGEVDPPRTDPVAHSFGDGILKRLLDEAEEWLTTLVNQNIWNTNIFHLYERVY